MTVNSERFVDFATHMGFEPKFTTEFRKLSSSFETAGHFFTKLRINLRRLCERNSSLSTFGIGNNNVGRIHVIRTEKLPRLSFDARIMDGNVSSKHEIINKSILLEYVKQQRLKESLALAYC